MHLRKSETEALLRVSGSIAFVAAARTVLGFGIDPNDPSSRVMVPIKSNFTALGSALAFQITTNADGVARLQWDKKPRNVDANAVLGVNYEDKQERATRRKEAEQWLTEHLAAGPRPQEEIEQKAKAAGIAWRTLMRAKAGLNVESHKAGMGGGWYWEMAKDCQKQPNEAPP
jgi:putative DNA primase/helicase